MSYKNIKETIYICRKYWFTPTKDRIILNMKKQQSVFFLVKCFGFIELHRKAIIIIG